MEKKPSVSNSREEAAEILPDSDKAKCYICLSPFEKQTVGSLEVCQHVFCLVCILQWSKTANTCPVDRLSFNVIHQRRCTGGRIQKKIKVKRPRSDDEESSGVICEECGRSDRREQLLVCTQCDSGYHMNCLTPSINTGPEDDWICLECAAVPQNTDSAMVLEEQISDGEVTDILSEVGETATTSSRLRPNTINHPSRFTEVRQSPRIQRQNREPHPQSPLHVPRYLIRAAKPAVTTNDVAAPPHSNASSLRRGKKRKRPKTPSAASRR